MAQKLSASFMLKDMGERANFLIAEQPGNLPNW
jgi:hypothetical protein